MKTRTVQSRLNAPMTSVEESESIRPKTLKMLSYNIHKGFSVGNLKFVLSHIREAIQEVHADLVFLQEVLGDHKHHGKHWSTEVTSGQFEYLADTIWDHFAYGKNAVYDAGHHGNAILSKYPLAKWENINISTNPLESRGLLHGELVVPGLAHHLHVICLHLDLFERGRRVQIEQLSDRIEKVVPQDAPLIIAGDFNDWRVRVSRVLVERLGLREAYQDVHARHARTFPSWLPILKLDRVYTRGFRTLHAESLTGMPWRSLSDHAAVYCEIEFEEGY